MSVAYDINFMAGEWRRVCSYLHVVRSGWHAFAVEALGFSPDLGTVFDFLSDNPFLVDEDATSTTLVVMVDGEGDGSSSFQFVATGTYFTARPSVNTLWADVLAGRVERGEVLGEIGFEAPGGPVCGRSVSEAEGVVVPLAGFLRAALLRNVAGERDEGCLQLTSSGEFLLAPVPPSGVCLRRLCLLVGNRAGLRLPGLPLAEQPGRDEVFGPMMCYLQLLHSQYRAVAASAYGAGPSLDVLSTMPVSWLDMECVRRLRVSRTVLGYHVGVDGDWTAEAFLQLAGVLRGVALGCREGIGVPLDTSLAVAGGDGLEKAVLEAAGLSQGVQARLVDAGLRLVFTHTAALTGSLKDERRTLSAMGDAALTLMVSCLAHSLGKSAQQYQELRSQLTNGTKLSSVFTCSPFVRYLVGFDPPFTVRVGAETMEALIGLVFKAGGLRAVHCLCLNVGLLPADSWVSHGSGTVKPYALLSGYTAVGAIGTSAETAVVKY